MGHWISWKSWLQTVLAVTVWTASCTHTTMLIDPRAAGTGRYSAAPTSAGWAMWPPPFLLVVMTSAQYEVAHYHHAITDDGLTPDPASPSGYALLPGDEGISVERTSESVGGTGLAFRAEGSSFLVLTSHHVVEFPETLDLEISSPLLDGERLLVARGYRKSRSTVVGRPAEGQAMATLVAYSVKSDLALLTADLRRFDPYVAPFPYEFGATDAVQAGNGVYVLGAPDGKFMVTWGVATPEAPSLLRVDTSTPAGYSGGAVLATRRDNGNLEFVGIVRGTAGTSRKVWEFDDAVAPGMRLAEADPSHVVARTLRTRDFGVTYCTPADRVRSFLERGLEHARRPHLLAPRNLDAD